LSDEDSDDEYAESSDQSVQDGQLQRIPTPQQTVYRVNRQFNELCTPLLYQELNFLSGGITSQSIHYFVAAKYGQHVRTLRILMNGIARQVPEESILKILGYCHNISSLALYYNSINSPTNFRLSSTLPDTIIRMIKEGNLDSIGFYSCKVVQDNLMYKEVPFAGPLFDEIAQSESASLLKRLDIALPRVPATTRDLICSRFTSLQSLTVRKALRRLDGSIWSGGCCKIWASYDNLTSLQLIGCTSVYPPDVPELVQHFAALEHLLVSACGLEFNENWLVASSPSPQVPPPRAYDPLGDPRYGSFTVDPEIYPRLQVLRAESLETGFGNEYNRVREKTVATALQEVCDKRGIELRRDGKWIFSPPSTPAILGRAPNIPHPDRINTDIFFCLELETVSLKIFVDAGWATTETGIHNGSSLDRGLLPTDPRNGVGHEIDGPAFNKPVQGDPSSGAVSDRFGVEEWSHTSTRDEIENEVTSRYGRQICIVRANIDLRGPDHCEEGRDNLSLCVNIQSI
ncbi:12614_t:CDS:2, partial [Acaulospora colombiana]